MLLQAIHRAGAVLLLLRGHAAAVLRAQRGQLPRQAVVAAALQVGARARSAAAALPHSAQLGQPLAGGRAQVVHQAVLPLLRNNNKQASRAWHGMSTPCRQPAAAQALPAM